jgi:hypothetical protein
MVGCGVRLLGEMNGLLGAMVAYLTAAVTTIPRCPLVPPPQLLWTEAALALMALRMVASCKFVGLPWMLDRVGVGKLLMRASGDGVEDAMLD